MTQIQKNKISYAWNHSEITQKSHIVHHPTENSPQSSSSLPMLSKWDIFCSFWCNATSHNFFKLIFDQLRVLSSLVVQWECFWVVNDRLGDGIDQVRQLRVMLQENFQGTLCVSRFSFQLGQWYALVDFQILAKDSFTDFFHHFWVNLVDQRMKLTLLFEGLMDFFKKFSELVLQIEHFQFRRPWGFNFEENSFFFGQGYQWVDDSQIQVGNDLVWDDWADSEAIFQEVDKERCGGLSHFDELEISDGGKSGINEFRIFDIVSDENTWIITNYYWGHSSHYQSRVLAPKLKNTVIFDRVFFEKFVF